MNIRKKVIVAVLVSLAGSMSALAGLIEWTDNFDRAVTAVAADWKLTTSWASTSAAHSSTQALYGGSANGAGFSRAIGPVSNQTFKIEFFSYLKTTGPITGVQQYGIKDTDVNTWTGFQTKLEMSLTSTTTGVFRAFNGNGAGGGTWAATNLVVANTWYKNTLVVTTDPIKGGTYDWYLNDVLVADNYNFITNKTTASMYFGSTRTVGSMQAFMDDISVSAIPEPTTLSMFVISSVGLLWVRKYLK